MLKPVVSVTSTIVALHTIKDGEGVSYHLKWKYAEPKPLEEALQETSLFPFSNGKFTMVSLFSEEEIAPKQAGEITTASSTQQIIAVIPFGYTE